MIERLACKLGRNDEVPNIELAEHLCENSDVIGIKEIVDGLVNKNKSIANDCIKVLYEIGSRNPELISGYADNFISCLNSKNNRLVWGGMTALATIVGSASKEIFAKLPIVVTAYKTGSVITVDNSISVFAGLCRANKSYEKEILPLILDHL